MSPLSSPLQWALVGLSTGAEAYGSLPPTATGRIAEFMNSELSDCLVLGRAKTEDVMGGAEVPELVTLLEHVSYVQPWTTVEAPGSAPVIHLPRGRREVEVSVVLKTRLNISGSAYLPPDMELTGLIGRGTDVFIPFGRATLSTSEGQSRPCPGIVINKHHILLLRELK